MLSSSRASRETVAEPSHVRNRMTTPSNSPNPRNRTSRAWLVFGGLLVAVLLGGVFTLGSLNVPFAPDSRTEFIVLFALSTFNIVALFIFGLILVRNLFRLWAERRTDRLGARFKIKMVLGAIGISLLPLIFMFFISYALMNRTLNKWFSRPLEIAAGESQTLVDQMAELEHQRLKEIATRQVWAAREDPAAKPFQFPILERGVDAAWEVELKGDAPNGYQVTSVQYKSANEWTENLESIIPVHLSSLPGGAEIWSSKNEIFLAARVPFKNGFLLLARRMPPTFLQRYAEAEAQIQAYRDQGRDLRAFKNQILLTLALFTVLLMFSSMWFALFLSKQVTGPIQALAQGTQEVFRGNLGYQVQVAARDELGILVNSFNQMTRQLADSRQQLDEFTRSLQQAVKEIEDRRKLMETILENIPTAVLSLDAAGGITRANQAALRMLGREVLSQKPVAELLGAETTRALEQQMRKALRMGTASAELEFHLPGSTDGQPGRIMNAAVTISALGTRRQNPGYVVVIDDLTELLRAQKATAWQEVAQRIAHEIKNPLTPIQLSAQRLMRQLDRSTSGQAAARDPELASLIGECAGLIEREVATLKSLVDEFSQFARFPAARLAPLDANAIVSGALDVFTGRLDGVTVRASYQEGLPPVKADAELLRRVLVNLIDNAAEAMEGATVRELNIATQTGRDGEMIEITVADSGHGISPEDKERLFLPHFSTRNRGTGLGLAIASRIISEHGGAIRVEDNSPVGARFVIKLPVAEAKVS